MPDLVALRRRAAVIAAAAPELLVQKDTFYDVPSGRLKLREIAGSSAELIFYHRSDSTGPKTSNYIRTPVADPGSMHQLLAQLNKPRRVVEKRRELFIVGGTRIHLDEVAGLGCFMELETVLTDDQTEADGERIVAGLIEQLGIAPTDLVAGAYVDLLEAQAAE